MFPRPGISGSISKTLGLQGICMQSSLKTASLLSAAKALTCLVTILMNNFAGLLRRLPQSRLCPLSTGSFNSYTPPFWVWDKAFSPICGFNYGAKRYDRVLKAFGMCLKVTIGAMIVLASVCLLFAPTIVHFFRDDSDVVAIGAKALRYQAVASCFCPITVLVNMLTQTMGKSGRATILASCRQGIFYLPLILFLPPVIGLLGIQLALSNF